MQNVGSVGSALASCDYGMDQGALVKGSELAEIAAFGALESCMILASLGKRVEHWACRHGDS